MQTRPCPTFGRPVHLGFPHRLRPSTSPHALRIPSCAHLLDGHPALRSTARGGFRSALAVSSFRLRARLGVSIPSSFSGQRGFIPAFGYGAPHSSARGTSTLLNNVLLSTHSLLVGLFHSLLHAGLSRRTEIGILQQSALSVNDYSRTSHNLFPAVDFTFCNPTCTVYGRFAIAILFSMFRKSSAALGTRSAPACPTCILRPRSSPKACWARKRRGRRSAA
jgi:hypothetical protein